MPKPNVVSNNVSTTLTTNLTVDGNKIIFFDGAIPATEDLYNITSETALLNAYGAKKVFEVTDLQFVYSYDVKTKEKTVKKIPVDALDTVYEIDATIGWVAVILNDSDNPTEDEKIILFTDTIGTWGDQTAPIIIDKYTGVAGDKNIFKDFSLILRDISTNEGV
jgi:hypothetical protein